MDWGKAQERLQCLQFFCVPDNFFLSNCILAGLVVHEKRFENKKECVFLAIKRAIKQNKTQRKYLEKMGSESKLLPFISLMAPLIPFVALIKKKQC